MSTQRGHRLVTHTADLVLEAWGPTREECFDEAIAALVDSYAEVLDRAASDAVPVAVDQGSDQTMLRALLEEVVALHDVLGVVPVAAELEPAEDGGMAGYFEVVPVANVTTVGAVPRQVDRHHLEVAEDGLGWHARVSLAS